MNQHKIKKNTTLTKTEEVPDLEQLQFAAWLNMSYEVSSSQPSPYNSSQCGINKYCKFRNYCVHLLLQFCRFKLE